MSAWNLKLVIALVLMVHTVSVQAQYIRFDAPTDSISLSRQTTLSTSVTYEAQVLFTPELQSRGFVFNEWTLAQEDKWFSIGPSRIDGFSFPTGGPSVLSSTIALALNQWHHIAYVHGGSQDLLYANGVLVGSRAAPGIIANASGVAFLGSIFRDGHIVDSFTGYLDSFRVSSIARYSGTSFIPPVGDLTTCSGPQKLDRSISKESGL